MVTSQEETLNHVFAALADSTRRSLLTRLARGDATVGELAEPFAVSRPAISKHLNILERAGLIHRVADGRVNRCHFDGAPLRKAFALMERYRTHWEHQLDTIARYLEQQKK